jgi:D-amino-acid dehydrogenase
MKIAVIGAGVIGVTTAYELAADGHQVSLFERRGAAAEEGSFANAGIVAPGYVTPWAAPGMPRKVLAQMFSRHAAMRLGPGLGVDELQWLWRFWRACRLDTYLAHRAHLQKLAFYSRERLHELTASLKLEYDRSEGYLVLQRSAKEAKLMAPGLQVLRDAGVVFKEIGMADARKLEPALNPDTEFAGAVHLPQDEAANCRQFVLLLKNEAQRLGAKLHFNTEVSHIAGAGSGVSLKLAGESGALPFDALVLCTGATSPVLLKSLGLKLSMVPVYGYSVSAPIREPLNAPRGAVMDERYKVAISRLGNRVRVAGGAEIGGSPEKHRAAAVQTLYKVLHDWFPGAAQLSSGVQEWKGARPMLAAGPPMVGSSGVPGVWLNLGHGSSGWALACGSARATADMLAGRKPALDMAGFAYRTG